jgi:hypothetical protein
MQDSNLREVRRLTNLLLRIKRYERQMEAFPGCIRYERGLAFSVKMSQGFISFINEELA